MVAHSSWIDAPARHPFSRQTPLLGLLMLVAIVGSVAIDANAQQNAVAPGPQSPFVDDQNRGAYQIERLLLRYLYIHPSLTDIEELRQLPIELARAESGYIMPFPGYPTVTTTIAEIAGKPVDAYYPSAVQAILEQLAAHFQNQGLLGYYVGPDIALLGPDHTTQDAAMADRTDFPITIHAGVVTDVRTLASGDRIDPEERENNPAHQHIRDQSPFKPYDSDSDEERTDLLKKDVLDEYIFFLSRHPGRRVDASLSPAQDDYTIALDYLITENRPWLVYGQVSNTGTRDTNRWRERFGLIHNQLTSNDDVFTLDYITAGFDESHAVFASYEAPFPHSPRWRWRVSGHWSEYTASDVGFAGERFKGESWRAGAEIIYNFCQRRQLFIDVVAGFRYDNLKVDNQLIGLVGEEDLIVPYVGVRLERRTERVSTLAKVTFEFQVGDTDPFDLLKLGRLAPDEDYFILRWDASHSFYLEPLFNPEAFDPAKIQEGNESTLAHELAIVFRGQYAFDNRLIPQEEMVVGGFYSVRGYPESVVAGDTVLIGSLEYRFHVPRAFPVQPNPSRLFGQDFRWAPQQMYGRPDWDLILRTFLDVGQTEISDSFSFESDQTLIGAGIGVELFYRRNINVRVDWGFVLDELEAFGVPSGSNRLHVIATLLY